MPHYSLVTFHSHGHTNLPKTHIAFAIAPSTLSNCAMLNSIPQHHNFVFEILLLDEAFSEYQPHLLNFVSWAEERNVQYLFTVPESYTQDLMATVPHINVLEITRPFPAANYPSTIT